MKSIFKSSLLVLAASFLLTGCNSYSKMQKNVSMLEVTSAPAMLSLVGKDVKTTYTVKFPAKYFNAKATLRITPVISWDGGTVESDPYFVQGEKVRDNYTVIPTAAGGSISRPVSFAFTEAMRRSYLELKIDSRQKNGTFAHFATVKIADGVSTVQELVDLAGAAAIAPDNFKRNTVISQDAAIMFDINRSNVRSSQLTSEEIKALEDFIVENSGAANKTVGNIYTKGYASPDGPTGVNNRLAQERARNAESAVNRRYSSDGNFPGKPAFDVEALGEDWEGFRELVAASNIPDRELILQVLSMYSDSERRESEIRNMASVYTVLKESILPQLRRTKLQVDVDVVGLSDDEIRTFATQDISRLDLEQTLYAATLFDDNASKQRIYKSAADRFNDYRAWNNYAVTLLRDGNITAASSALASAARLNNSSNEVINNLGLVALADGKYEDARRYLSSVSTPDARRNLGLVDIFEGKYTDAVRSLEGYNQAVAYVLNGDLTRAKAILANVDTAKGEYLKAVVAAREGDTPGVISGLRSATAKDAALKQRARTDIEFARWGLSPEFTSVVM